MSLPFDAGDIATVAAAASFAGGLVGGAVAGLASAVARWRKWDRHAANLAKRAARAAIEEHEQNCRRIPPGWSPTPSGSRNLATERTPP